ncbi:MAG: AAA family ATPase [Tindallia sp. MSAO_Bac2]|nr:MAG: AAA family ATPase [Tindallia sp. MSAO_Bac2]
MKKKITILAINKEISLYFIEELHKIFDDLFEYEYKTPNMTPMNITTQTDLILYTDPEILNLLSHTIQCDTPYLMMKRTITKKALQRIRNIPKGSRAVVCNINQYMANETMALIYQLGITDLRLFPYYEGKSDLPEADFLITPEYYSFLPETKAEVLVIGNRVFDISNILDILSILMVSQDLSDQIQRKYLMKVPTFWHGAKYALENRRVLMSQWRMLMDELQRGIMVLSDQNVIDFINQKMEKNLSLEQSQAIGKELSDIVTENCQLSRLISGPEELVDEPVKYQGRELIVNLRPIIIDNQYYGKLVFIDLFTEIADVPHRVQKKLIQQGLFARYTFDDLTGFSKAFLQAKKLAQKIALSQETVLLQGESGVGKELFSAAIHNASSRKKMPFVAINCTTLPENLLESELFGYEEGAFTGAVKGGKTGLFEKANQGTLFLDEIGDLPLTLQARLLRALEEREIMRVGGDSIISVDVRIIAATNRNLADLVEKKLFRADLYYRLNVLQIMIPPLRNRKEDIEIFFRHFMDLWNIQKYYIDPPFNAFLQRYSWPGNVRELRNVLKYVVTVSDRYFSTEHLPSYLKTRELLAGNSEDESNLFLRFIYQQQEAGENTGRRNLAESFSQVYYDISEMRVRKILETLCQKGFLRKNIGRKGHEITDAGITHLSRHS